jgi:hypothetical protein
MSKWIALSGRMGRIMNSLTFEGGGVHTIILIAYSLLSIQNSVTMAGLRAVGSYAVGTAGSTTIQVVANYQSPSAT